MVGLILQRRAYWVRCREDKVAFYRAEEYDDLTGRRVAAVAVVDFVGRAADVTVLEEGPAYMGHILPPRLQ